jgi:hypothetical protein
VVIYFERKDWKKAETVAPAWVEGLRRVRGPDDPGVLSAAYSVSLVYLNLHRYPEAESIRRDVLARRRRVLGESHIEVANTMYGMGVVALAQGRRAEALSWLRQSVDHGYSDAGYMAKDESLASLRGDRAFDAIVAEARKKAPAPAPAK